MILIKLGVYNPYEENGFVYITEENEQEERDKLENCLK